MVSKFLSLSQLRDVTAVMNFIEEVIKNADLVQDEIGRDFEKKCQ